MRGSFSLADELRAIRNGSRNDKLAQRTPNPEKDEKPWQRDIERMQEEIREMLQSVSFFSGIEAGSGPQSPEGSVPRLDFNALKDRIRNDLETFSLTTTEELTKRAEEEARAKLQAIESEVQGKIDQVAAELREKLQGQIVPDDLEAGITQQTRDRVTEMVRARTDEFAQWVWAMCKGTDTPIPVQIERMLEPYVNEAIARYKGTVQHRVNDLLSEQEGLIQERLQNSLKTFQGQLTSLEQASLQICEQNADSVAKQSAEKLHAAADEAVKNFEGRIGGEIESAADRFQSRLQEMAVDAQTKLKQQEDLQAEGFTRKLDELSASVRDQRLSEITGHIEQTAADIIGSSVQHLHEQAGDATEHSKQEIKAFLTLEMEEVRRQIADLGRSVHESISKDAERVANTLGCLDQELAAIRDRHIAASEEQLSNVIQRTLNTLAASVKQISDAHLEEMNRAMSEFQNKAASQYESRLQSVAEEHYQKLWERLKTEASEASVQVVEEVRASSESVMQELSGKLSAQVSSLKEEAVAATSRIDELMKASLESYRQQLAQIASTGLEEQRKTIAGSVADLHNRLKRAAELLVSSNSQS
jgi:hypothetical protein